MQTKDTPATPLRLIAEAVAQNGHRIEAFFDPVSCRYRVRIDKGERSHGRRFHPLWLTCEEFRSFAYACEESVGLGLTCDEDMP